MRDSINTEPNQFEEEKTIEKALRPKSFAEFSGQKKITDNLKVFIGAARKRDEGLDHVLLTGPP
jgi:Holliday junction DNA helicase RuvB